jgi:pimeloyl-ACP methyl ester carboxylesterase
VKGIISYGSGYRPFFEYVLDIQRSQAELAGESQTDIANEMKFTIKLWGEYLGEKKSQAEILKTATGDYKKFVEASFPGGQAFGRHYTFFQNLFDLNLPEAWGKVNADVLAMWGKSDFISREIDHKMLVENMNKKRAGSARLVELENTDHLFFLAKDFKDSFEIINKLSILPPGFEPTSNPKYLDVVLDWLKKESR